MCGRYTLSSSGDTLADVLGLDKAPDLEARYNIAPGQLAPVCLETASGRRCETMLWGLEAREAGGRPLINARSETAADKPTFSGSFAGRRALVPADGFFEWQRLGGGRVAHYFRLREGRPFAMAGLWMPGPPTPGGAADPEPDRFVILTTAANDRVGRIHDRMPVILDPESHARWLDPDVVESDRLRDLLVPLAADRMESWTVSSWVNSAFHEGARCIEPAAPPPVQSSLF